MKRNIDEILSPLETPETKANFNKNLKDVEIAGCKKNKIRYFYSGE